jgi:hypothetical protein
MEKESDIEAASPPPRNCFSALLGDAVQVSIMAIIYIPFSIAIISQSVVTRIPVIPAEHKEHLNGKFWAIGWAAFLVLFAMPWVLSFGLLSSGGLWNPVNATSDSVLFSLMFYAIIFFFVILHFLTIDYANMRKCLREINPNPHNPKGVRFTLMNVAKIVGLFTEVFQVLFFSQDQVGLLVLDICFL